MFTNITRELSDILNERHEEEIIENEKLEPECEGSSNDASCNGDYNKCVTAPRLKIGSDGQLVLDEKSLCIKTTAAKENENLIIETVEENGDDYCYGKYNKKRKRSTDWTFKETVRFYKALSTVGTDFLLMQSLFQWRSREELKLKFKKEERLHKELIDSTLAESTQFDFSIFEESDYDPEEDRKAVKNDDAKKKKDIREQKKRKSEDKINEKKALRRQNKQRKQLLRRTFKTKKGLRHENVQVIDEDSNESRATSILVDAQEVIFEMTVLDKDTDENSLNQCAASDEEQPSCNIHDGDSASSLCPQISNEIWFDVGSIKKDQFNNSFVELSIDDSIKKIPVPSVKEDTSHVVVVIPQNQSEALYHVYLATCSIPDNSQT